MDKDLLAYIADRLHDAHRELETTKVKLSDDPAESDALRSLGRAQKTLSVALERLDPNYEDDWTDFFGRAENQTPHIVDCLHDAHRELETTKVKLGVDPSESDALRSLGRAQKAVSSALKRLDPYYVEDFDFIERAEDE